MTQATKPLFEAVREACFPDTWSRGVSLWRMDAVVGEAASDDEVVLRVNTRSGMICPQVTLYPDDLDWDCECGERQKVCSHVAAAVIALRRAEEEGKSLPVPSAPTGRVGYRLARTPGGIELSREIVVDGEAIPLTGTLAAVADGRMAGPRFMATQADLSIELSLGTHRRGPLPAHLVPKVLRGLARAEDVTLDGEPVQIGADPVLPRVSVEDQGEGFCLTLSADPTVTESFANDVVLCGDTLRGVADPKLTGRELHELPRGRHYSADEVSELVTRVLPGLGGRVNVVVRTAKLPDTSSERPRLVLDLDPRGEELSVLATLVYGAPATARIDAGKLVHLRGAVPVRDEEAERRELRRLQSLGLAAGVRETFQGEEAVAFNARLEQWKGETRGTGRTAFRLVGALTPQVRVAGARLEVAFGTGDDPQGAPRGRAAGSADPETVLRAWRAGESLVPLLQGGWASLPHDWLGRFGGRIADLLAARRADGSLPASTLGDLGDLCEELDLAPPPGADRLRALARSFAGIPQAALPADLATTLRPYQQSGVDWLVFLRGAGLGALLADDMGLGKTLQALCALTGRTLVVAPTSVLHNWAAEIARHRPGLTACIYHGAKRELDPAADVTLTTYALLRLDAERLSAVSWDTLILDEAQNIKNPDSRVSRAAFGLEAGFRMALTGTPVENRLEELWSQFRFLNRGHLGGLRDFRERYADPIGCGDADAAARLRARIRPFVLRRLKGEVAADLPPRTEMVLRCELSGDEREVYDAIRATTVSEVVSKLDAGGNVIAALEALLRLRQAACHAGLVPGQTADTSAKLQLLLEALDSVIAEGHRALVFSQWTSLLDLAEPALRDSKIPFLRLDGSTRDRAGVVQAFQEDDGPPVLLISLKAGGTGLNLTAADHIFLLDPWWNPAVEDQAADRAHRIGQQRPVMIYRLVAAETVEERILDLQERKRGLAAAALGDARGAASLTRDDLLDLLQ